MLNRVFARLVRKLNSWLWGYDFFISYHWNSGAKYAETMATRLKKRGFEVFLDRSEYAKGDNWKKEGQTALRNTKRLIVIGTKEALTESQPVAQEVEFFAKRSNHIILVAFGCEIDTLECSCSPVLQHITTTHLHIKEHPERQRHTPSIHVLKELVATHHILRRRSLRTAIATISILLLTLALTAVTMSRANAIRSRNKAVDATIRSINDDNLGAIAYNVSRSGALTRVYRSRLRRRVTELLDDINHAAHSKARATEQQEHQLDLLTDECARYITTLAGLGCLASSNSAFAYSRDMRLRTRVIVYFRRHLQQHDNLLDEIKRQLSRKDRESAGTRQALLLCLPSRDKLAITPDRFAKLVAQLTDSFCYDPDPGVHSAIDWLLRRWGLDELLDELNRKLSLVCNERSVVARIYPTDPNAHWFVTQTGHTMVVIPPGAIEMGIPEYFTVPSDARGRIHSGEIHVRYWYAMATKELDMKTFHEFVEEANLSSMDVTGSRFDGYSSEYEYVREHFDGRTTPAMNMRWSVAMDYCRWLTNRDRSNFPCDADEWYSYRLPTEAEWQLACSAGAATPRFFGYSADDLEHYAAFSGSDLTETNYRERLPRAIGDGMPNRLGLFDMYGNVEEMCLDQWEPNYHTMLYPASPYETAVRQGERAVRGGDIRSSRQQCFSAYRRRVSIEKGSFLQGFRIAKSICMGYTQTKERNMPKLIWGE